MKFHAPRLDIVFKDSINFFQGKLSDLPKTFGFQNIAKGTFPHKFNKIENYGVILDHLPDIEYYQHELMSKKDAEEFLSWYNSNYETEFNFQRELTNYCVNDVMILTEACRRFRSNMLKETRIDPFRHASTIAGFAIRVFLTSHLREKTITNAPDRGYRKHYRQSISGINYLLNYAKENNLTVRTALSAEGEYRIEGTNYKVDGMVYVDGKPTEALEYLGCYYHGCKHCYPARDTVLINGKTAEELYKSTMDRIKIINEKYPTRIFWECQVQRNDKVINDIPEPLNIRKHVLKGGRTETFCYYHKLKEGEKMLYVDYVSDF